MKAILVSRITRSIIHGISHVHIIDYSVNKRSISIAIAYGFMKFVLHSALLDVLRKFFGTCRKPCDTSGHHLPYTYYVSFVTCDAMATGEAGALQTRWRTGRWWRFLQLPNWSIAISCHRPL